MGNLEGEKTGQIILKRLKTALELNLNRFTVFYVGDLNDPFKVLIATILSQNTNDKNSITAFNKLKESLELRPEVLVSSAVEEIENAIKIAGLYREKSRAVKALSKIILEKYQGNLWNLLNKPLEEARRELLKLPKVGRKTADVLLLFTAKKPTFPVDVHITRISKRLGIVDFNANYEEIRKKLMKMFKPKDYLEAHLLLIEFGRRVCKSKRPRCSRCPIADICAKIGLQPNYTHR